MAVHINITFVTATGTKNMFHFLPIFSTKVLSKFILILRFKIYQSQQYQFHNINFKMEYTFVPGIRGGSELLHVFSENNLYVFKIERKIESSSVTKQFYRHPKR